MGEAHVSARIHPFPLTKQCAIGAFLWLCVALVLEPGNLMHGAPPAWSHEVVRLGLATLLFGSAGPLIFGLVKTWPIRSCQARLAIVAHLAAISLLSVGYLAIGNAVAQFILDGPGIRHLPKEIAANFTLLFACFAVLDAAAHFFVSKKQACAGYIRHINVKSKHGSFQLPLDQIEQMDAQENYVALHTATQTHLVRMTLSALMEKLDPALFTRIHRSIVINRAHIAKIKTVGNGKIQLTLLSGRDAMASRAYADSIRALWRARQ
jgi:hypothetical protein